MRAAPAARQRRRRWSTRPARPRRRAFSPRRRWARPRPRSIACRRCSYGTWFDEQFAKAQTLHRLYINQASADAAAVGTQISEVNFFDSWWSQALGGEDQLRQRVAFALSEIFVVSSPNATLQAQPRGVASYYDMLGDNAFGNYRDLLEDVT